MFNDIAYLCAEEVTQDEFFNETKTYTERLVFAQVRSIGMREFYAAATADLHPSMTLVLADYLEYQGEKLVKYDGTYYDVTRTYRDGNKMELVLTERMGGNGSS